MYTVKTSWTFGNFQISAEADLEITPPVNDLSREILEAGLLQVLQRVPSSRAEKAVAKYEKRPKGFQRNSIAYSTDTAVALIAAFGTEVKVEESKLTFRITDITEHVGGETAEPSKEAKALWVDIQGFEGEKFTRAMAKLGLDEEDYDDERGERAVHQMLLAQKRADDAARLAKMKQAFA